ncbi:MAG: hypothetical protein JXB05_39085 [Myxococcaceae bacterium]|nr:hypothetical protein [Myxococcaceae bacterium]
MLRSLTRRLLTLLSVTAVALGGPGAALAHAAREAVPPAGKAAAVAPCTCGPVSDPEWLRGAVVYGVVPPLFGARPFKGVTERLDSLKELGERPPS